MRSQALNATVTYRLHAIVQQYYGPLRWKTTSSRELEFRPLWPPDIQLHEPVGPRRFTYGTRNRPPADGHSPHDSPPPYEPSILLQVDVPWPLVLQIGKPVNIGVSVTVPRELQESLGKVFLQGLSIRLKKTTTASVAGNVRSHVDTMTVCGLTGLLPIDVDDNLETVALPDTLWKSCVTPGTAPSFRCFTLEVKHEVEIVASFSNKGVGSVQVRAPQI